MFKRFTRQKLYALVWDQPMTTLAAEFGLSDVALQKICRKHRVPTPPAGYWQKKAHGKRVTTTVLPDPQDQTVIVIREGSAVNEPEAIAEARRVTLAATQSASVSVSPNVIVERTLSKLASMRRGADGLIRSQTGVRMIIRPESIDRASDILRRFIGAAEQAGLELINPGSGASWLCDDQIVAFELLEVADRIAHIPTEKELVAVTKWKRERDEHHRRYGHWRDWGEPKIPKWEQRFQGRLAIKLEEVRVQTEQSWWGEVARRTFSDTRTRDVTKLIPQAVAAIAAIAATKKHNREMEARRRAAEQERARQRQEAERRRQDEQKATALVRELIDDHAAADRWRSVLARLGASQTPHPRTRAFVRWVEQQLSEAETRLTNEAIETRLTLANLFESEKSQRG